VVTKTPRNMNIEANTGDTDNITLLAILQAWPPRTWGSLAERALHQADRLHRFAARSGGGLVVVRTRADLEGVLAAWRGSGRDRGSAPGGVGEGAHNAPVAAFLGLEGAHALEGDLANVDRLFEAGFRMFGLTHFFDNEVGASAHGVSQAGLTEFGARVLARMEELGIAVDLAHASPGWWTTSSRARPAPCSYRTRG